MSKIGNLTIAKYENSYFLETKPSHSNELPIANEYTCLYCPNIIRKSKKLSRHTNSIHSKVPIKCYECGEIFSRRDNLNIHTRNQHDFSSLQLYTENIYFALYSYLFNICMKVSNTILYLKTILLR